MPLKKFRVSVALACAIVFLAMAPLAGALGVHHEFAAADHDGHQHSDFDLCKWVQFNSGNSLALESVEISKPWVEFVSFVEIPYAAFFSYQFSKSTTPRGPPLS